MLRKNLYTCFHLVFIVEQFIRAAHLLNIEMRLSISYEWNITFVCSCYDGYSSPKCTAPCEPLWHGQQQEPGVTLRRFWKPNPVAVLLTGPVACNAPGPLIRLGGLKHRLLRQVLPLRLGQSITSWMVNLRRSRWCACLKTTLLVCRAMDALDARGAVKCWAMEPWSLIARCNELVAKCSIKVQHQTAL